MSERIAVIGLGYVGLPVALAFARHLPTVGFDIDRGRIAELRAHEDRTREAPASELEATACLFTDDPADLVGATFFVVTVPTPIDDAHRPDLRALQAASHTVGRALEPGAVVVFESTVYPGVTEKVCGPVLEAESGLKAGVDFHLGYSPERINPGDREHTLERITKVVAGDDAATLDRVARTYERIALAGVHRAPSIQVAEAAKVIENTQRDLNIALMNELAIVLHRVGIRTSDVLEAARTKWNFLPFTPGLVGGHCIGVDPYYLTHLAEQLGYRPEVILAGRRINDGMGAFVAQRTVKAMAQAGHPVGAQSRVAVVGLAFKPDVPDLRNSRVPDVLAELASFGIQPLVVDPLVDPDQARAEYGLELAQLSDLHDLHALVFAVPHAVLLEDRGAALAATLLPDGVIFDVKSALDPALVEGRLCVGL